MYCSFDPERDYDRYDKEQQERLDRLPVCAECGEPIQQDTALYYNGEWYCDDCEQELWHRIRESLWRRCEQ